MRNVAALLAFASVVCLLAGCPNPIDDGDDGEPATYTVSYDGTAYTSGTVPTDGGHYESGADVVVAGPGTMSRATYFFAGWNSAADGSGTWYTPGSTIAMPSHDLVLHAQWPFAMSVVPARDFLAAWDNSILDETVTQTFQLGRTEVTYALWYEVRQWAQSNGYSIGNAGVEGSNAATEGQAPSLYGSAPVTRVNWRDVMAWCNALTEWLNARSGSTFTCAYYTDAAHTAPIRTSTSAAIDTTPGTQDAPYVLADASGFRLPTRSEWELAARYRTDSNNDGDICDAGEYTSGTWASGATAFTGNIEATSLVGWHNGNSTAAQPVGGRTPNALSIHDMSGNVYEWCFDWKTTNSARVYRGGSWNVDREFLGVFEVLEYAPNEGSKLDLGFRFARSAPAAMEPHFVSYDGNGSTGGTVPADPDAHLAGDTVHLSDAGSMTRTGHSFTGWNTAADGSGTDYASGDIAMPDADLRLYAQWQVNTYVIYWYGNGNTAGSPPAGPSGYLEYQFGDTVTVYGDNGMTKTDCLFAGWNTTSSGSGTPYVPGTTFTMPAGHLGLYAQWFTAMPLVPAKSFFTGTDDSGSATITSAFRIAKYEVTYALWYAVRTWAEGAAAYHFANSGREGHNGVDGAAPTAASQEPVTNINWRDALVWCNALTQWLNTRAATSYTCAYYGDAGYAGPLLDSRDGAFGSSVSTTPGSVDVPYVRATATGFRLPGNAEWELAARYLRDFNNDGDIKDAGDYYPGNYASGATADITNAAATGLVAWYLSNTASTQPVGGRVATPYLGLYDLSGNAEEWCFDLHPGFGDGRRVTHGGAYNLLADRLQVGWAVDVFPFEEEDRFGLRVARNGP